MILPLGTPELKSYPIYGLLTAILATGREDYQEWLFNNFIQLRYLKNDHIVFFEQYRSLLKSCPYISEEIVSRETMEGKSIDYVDFLKDSINNNKYILLYCDRFYLREFKAFGVYHITHELFVYGYDDDKKHFICMDNNEEGFFSTIFVSYEEMQAAIHIEDSLSFFRDIHLIRRDEWWGIERIDENNIKTLFGEYIHSTYRRNMCEPFTAVNYGFNIHYDVLDDLKNYMRENKLDIRSMFVLLEHKELMKKRFLFLSKHTNDLCYWGLSNGYDKLKTKYNFLKLMLLKADIQQTNSAWLKAISTYQSLIDEELALVTRYSII